MNVTIEKSSFGGKIKMASSKSHLHRALICASLGDKPCKLYYNGSSDDVVATINCLNALGAQIADKGEYFEILPIKQVKNGILPCNESGSTLRFMLPIACALGAECTLTGTEKLISRPLEPLISQLEKHGAKIEKYRDKITVSGRLTAGKYTVRGDISSQFITGLLLALPLLENSSELEITGNIQSRPYIDMTLSVLRDFGMETEIDKENHIKIPTLGRFKAPDALNAEGDWSNAAFWLVLGALSEKGIEIDGLLDNSTQGDKKMLQIIGHAGAHIVKKDNRYTVKKCKIKAFECDCADTPDLAPAISILASVCDGESRIHNVERLRLKESDRIETTMAMVRALGGEIRYENGTLIINGKPNLNGGMVDSCNDHRIAMAAAVASAVCEENVTILGANSVNKSYRSFWEVFEAIGGNVKKWEE
ncbi:MAG: 3-phosphoshikimate 1-carboxyvinyltransferase [Clostridia bacterium]|nr:3-phosphoshikimate 1-carboxyvinyltransferase [Clostridia bacterium]